VGIAVIECRGFPCTRRMADRAIERERRLGVLWSDHIVIVHLVAARA
jgi:hypothetical protein